MLKNLSLIRLCRARDRLRETRDDVLSVRDVAKEAQLSAYHFIRQFAAVFGQTPHQFRIDARLDKAKSLLAADHHSVTDVCMEVGFSSLGSFSDLFSRRIGVAPSAYRRQLRSLVSVPGTMPAQLIPGCFSLMFGAVLPRIAIFKKH
jgi:AraC-like DNA-binding protein